MLTSFRHGLIRLLGGSVSKPLPTGASQEGALAQAKTIEECMAVYLTAQSGSTLESRAAEKLLKITATLDGLLEIYQQIPRDSKLALAIVPKLKEYAKTFESWQSVLEVEDGISDRAFFEYAVLRLADGARSFKEWAIACSYAYKGGAGEQVPQVIARAEKEFVRLEGSFEDWRELYRDAPKGSALEKLALEKAIAAADDLSELSMLYQDAPGSSKEEDAVAAAIEARTDAMAEWKELYEENIDDRISGIALSKMIKLITDIDSASDVVAVCEGDDERLKEIEAVFSALAVSRDSLVEAVESGSYDSSMLDVLLRELLKQSDTVSEIVEIDVIVRANELDVDSDLTEEVARKAVSAATLEELRLIDLLSESDSELETKAREALSSKKA